ncbi:hypothetical protein KC678_03330 [Candidatus Dojkabacteria bacterium]|uniref:Uncharacterized protein n=1 Tax=Candidatus Dojkabacteria bacterium TaxID=2099670 RepID=A0A955L1Q9_9BACT|nr:hypothetical protein [Candidatus Dojkabacteria bacterium]
MILNNTSDSIQVDESEEITVYSSEGYPNIVNGAVTSLEHLLLFLSNPSENINRYCEDFVASGKLINCLTTVQSALNSCLKGEDSECVSVLLRLNLGEIRDSLENFTIGRGNVIYISKMNELITLQTRLDSQVKEEQ